MSRATVQAVKAAVMMIRRLEDDAIGDAVALCCRRNHKIGIKGISKKNRLTITNSAHPACLRHVSLRFQNNVICHVTRHILHSLALHGLTDGFEQNIM